MMNFAIVVSQFNQAYTQGLLEGALNYFNHNASLVPLENPVKIYQVAGAFEIPLIVKKIASLQKYNGIIALGCVIQGETDHYQWICQNVSEQLMQISVDTLTPIGFGLITTFNEAQAHARTCPNESNKGYEAACACVMSASLMTQIK